MATALDTITGYFFGGPVSTPYHTNEGATIEQGVDIARPAGSTVRLVNAGTVVFNNGYQLVVQVGDALYESYTHIESSLRTGTTLPAGSPIGVVSARTGWPLYAGGAPYYSTGPHLEFGVYSSLANATSFVAGINPASDLSSTYVSRTSGGATSPVCGIPLLGGPVCDVTGAVTGTVGGILGGTGNAISGVGSTISGIGSLPGQLGAIPGDIASGIAGQIEHVAGWAGQHLIKWVILIVIGIAALVILDQLVSGGKGATGAMGAMAA